MASYCHSVVCGVMPSPGHSFASQKEQADYTADAFHKRFKRNASGHLYTADPQVKDGVTDTNKKLGDVIYAIDRLGSTLNTTMTTTKATTTSRSAGTRVA